MIELERIITDKYPSFFSKPPLLVRPTLALLRKLLHEQEINDFLGRMVGLEGFDFIERVLEHFNFSYRVSSAERENIPASGRVVIVANHPLGSLDGLALLKMVGEVRRDVRIIANDVLMRIKPLHNMLLPVEVLGGGTKRSHLDTIVQVLENEEAVIVFPSGEVSRARPTGIKDGRWRAGFLHFAERTRSPILPVHIAGKNSALFYSVSMLSKPLSMLLLVREMFKQRNQTLTFRIGQMIPWHALQSNRLPAREKVQRVKRHVYGVSKNRRSEFGTESSVAHPESRQALRKELQSANLLGETKDGKQIYLYDYHPNSVVMREIGRLREIAFRKVGEGVNQRRDLDQYDFYYRHLILWDDEDLEIAGAYRIGEAARVLDRFGTQGLYTSSLFRYDEAMSTHFAQGLELGRSFVQPRYWGMRSLDYLWYGIGAYLKQHPEIRYLFGPVSISNRYTPEARDRLVYFYRKHFGDRQGLALANHRYTIAHEHLPVLAREFKGASYEQDFRILKEKLAEQELAVPTLYKQYSEVCEPGGVRFLDFGVDANFGHCVDGLVLVDLHHLKASRRERYLGEPMQTAGLPMPAHRAVA